MFIMVFSSYILDSQHRFNHDWAKHTIVTLTTIPRESGVHGALLPVVGHGLLQHPSTGLGPPEPALAAPAAAPFSSASPLGAACCAA